MNGCRVVPEKCQGGVKRSFRASERLPDGGLNLQPPKELKKFEGI
jgi:hypothetical protein